VLVAFDDAPAPAGFEVVVVGAGGGEVVLVGGAVLGVVAAVVGLGVGGRAAAAGEGAGAVFDLHPAPQGAVGGAGRRVLHDRGLLGVLAREVGEQLGPGRVLFDQRGVEQVGGDVQFDDPTLLAVLRQGGGAVAGDAVEQQPPVLVEDGEAPLAAPLPFGDGAGDRGGDRSGAGDLAGLLDQSQQGGQPDA